MNIVLMFVTAMNCVAAIFISIVGLPQGISSHWKWPIVVLNVGIAAIAFWRSGKSTGSSQRS